MNRFTIFMLVFAFVFQLSSVGNHDFGSSNLIEYSSKTIPTIAFRMNVRSSSKLLHTFEFCVKLLSKYHESNRQVSEICVMYFCICNKISRI